MKDFSEIIKAIDATEVHLQDKIVGDYPLDIGNWGIHAEDVPSVTRVIGLITKSDDDFVKCSNGATITMRDAKRFRFNYLEAVKQNLIICLATDSSGNPIGEILSGHLAL